MKQRIISALIGVLVLVAVLFSSELVFNISLVIITNIAIYEVTNAIGLKNRRKLLFISWLFPLAVLFVPIYTALSYLPITVFYLLALLTTMLFFHKDYSFNDICIYFTTTVLIAFSFIHFSLVRHMEYGLINVFIVFIGCWITDTCAYFTGVFLGKHKLAPSISPKKTIEGSVGGILGVSIIITLYAFVVSKVMNIEVNVLRATVLGIICGIVSQFGDLCASIIKREHNIKDFGNIMPGHGGVMDRFDSALFVAPIVYYFIIYFPIFK